MKNKLLKKDYKLLFISIVSIYIVSSYSIYRANYTTIPLTFIDNLQLFDISPLPQILAILIFGLIGVILTQLFIDSFKFNIWVVLALIPMIIFPYFIPVLQSKLSILFFAFAMLLSILPFIFQNNLKKYLLISFICLFLSLFITKSFVDVYLIILLFICFKNIINKKFEFKFLIYSIICFIVVVILYKIIFNESLVHFNAFNAINFFRTISYDLKRRITIPIILIIIAFIFYAIKKSKINRFFTFLLSINIFVLLFIIIYLKLVYINSNYTYSNNFYCFGLVISILLLFIFENKNNFLNKILIIALCWRSINVVTVYGNMISTEQKYNHFVISMLLNDINNLNKNNVYNKIAIKGDMGYSLTTHMYVVVDHNWVVEYLINTISDKNILLFKKYLNDLDNNHYDVSTFNNAIYETYIDNSYYILGYNDDTIFITFNDYFMNPKKSDNDIEHFRVC